MHKEHKGIHSQEQAQGGAGAASTGLWGDTASSTGSSSQCEEGTGTSIFPSTLKQAVIILHLAQSFFHNYFLQIYLCMSIFLQEQEKKKKKATRDRCMDSRIQGKCVLISNRFVLSVIVRTFGSLSIIFLLQISRYFASGTPDTQQIIQTLRTFGFEYKEPG